MERPNSGKRYLEVGGRERKRVGEAKYGKDGNGEGGNGESEKVGGYCGEKSHCGCFGFSVGGVEDKK